MFQAQGYKDRLLKNENISSIREGACMGIKSIFNSAAYLASDIHAHQLHNDLEITANANFFLLYFSTGTYTVRICCLIQTVILTGR